QAIARSHNFLEPTFRSAHCGSAIMKAANGLIPLVLLTLITLLFPGCQHPRRETSDRDSLRVGAAEIDITPPLGHRMAGYVDERLSTGVHDPLKAKAIIVQQGQEQIALV